ncbi:hypothetical protein [Vibrio jasicida]|uniref:hypothetical protein n=1 Tax=Vibrio jasicida TaxID=766224 RepID=UPI0006962E39|nr:hypothetical protein [Vibrio jasicida]
MQKRITQAGISLIDTLLALSITGLLLLIFIPMGIKHYQQKQVDEFTLRVNTLITKIQLYQFHKSKNDAVGFHPNSLEYLKTWPATFDALMTDYGSSFWPFCGPTDQANSRCFRPDYVPFSNRALIGAAGWDGSHVPPLSAYRLTIPTGDLPDDGPRALWGLPLLRIPGAKLQSNGDIEVLVTPLAKSIMYDEFLRKDGSVFLTQDWDVGGQHAITNIKDVTLRNSDGSQKLVSKGLSETYMLEHGDWLDKGTCPAGLTPEPILGVGRITIDDNHTLTGSVAPFVQAETPTRWQVAIEARVRHNSTGVLTKRTEGKILAIVQCR